MNEHAHEDVKEVTASENLKKFKKVRKAIKDRDIAEVSWALLEMCIQDLEECGETKLLGKTGLMEMVRIVSVQKNEGNQQAKLEKVSEMREWLRRAG
jgi:hypothetical protein